MAQISSRTGPEMAALSPAGARARKARQSLAEESTALRDAFLGRTEEADNTAAGKQGKNDKGPSAFARIAGQMKGQSKPQEVEKSEPSPWDNRLKLGKLVFAGMMIVYIVVQVPQIKDGLTEIAALHAGTEQTN
jgi:hypothetical protein